MGGMQIADEAYADVGFSYGDNINSLLLHDIPLKYFAKIMTLRKAPVM